MPAVEFDILIRRLPDDDKMVRVYLVSERSRSVLKVIGNEQFIKAMEGHNSFRIAIGNVNALYIHCMSTQMDIDSEVPFRIHSKPRRL